MGKFLLLHIDDENSNDFLKQAQMDGVERGVYVRSDVSSKILNHFNIVKERGYFPVALVVDDQDPNNIEYMFKRHPNQTKEMKLAEMSDTDFKKL